MNPQEQFVAFQTIFYKEIKRFLRIWSQTILPPVITTVLYFLIFGTLIGGRIGEIEGFSYMQYIVPGLIMMSVITNSYSNVVSSFYGAKFAKAIEEMLVSPMPNYIIVAGYVAGGVARGLCVGFVVTVVALFFTDLHLEHIVLTMSIVLLTSILFSLAGLLNGLFANSFDEVNIIPTFVLTPLTYLGGVFYSVNMLPDFWRNVSFANPILYMVNGFRYGILGVSDIDPALSLVIISIVVVGFFCLAMWCLNRGKGIRH
ncbi:MAG: ABC transporter permease [Gammaproteobacteria bacterium]|nr:ABC transporter permease [Gammaproteobacteria bacterium]